MHDNRPAHKVMLVLVLFYAIPVAKVWSQTLKHGACRCPVCNGEGRVRPADPEEFVDGDAVNTLNHSPIRLPHADTLGF